MSGMSMTSSTTLRTEDTSKVLPGDKTGLPLEVWQMIFSYLSFRDLCHVARVSKTWYDLALSIDVTRWKELYLTCGEWRHPYWPVSTNLEPSSWKTAFCHQHMSTRFWHRCSQQAQKTGCIMLFKRIRERQVIEVGPGLQHETLKSAFAVANEYDKILVHPGIYDEQLELSMKFPFELVGVGELGSIILVQCLEHVAVSGRLSNLVLRAPWFSNFILKVRSGYLQMDNCIMEDGMMCVTNPAACHIQFCTFRHATIILQHINASVIRNCEFSQSNNANIVIEGYPKEEKCWAYPYLCQEMVTAISHKPSSTHPHPLKATESTTSTLHSTFTSKSFTASTVRTFDTLSRGRAGSQEVDVEGRRTMMNNAVGHASHSAVNKTGSNNAAGNSNGNHAHAMNGKQVSGLCALDFKSECRRNSGHDNAADVNATECSHGGSAEPFHCNGARKVDPSLYPVCKCEGQAGNPGQCTKDHTLVCPAVCSRAGDSKAADAEWLEISDERKAWQVNADENRHTEVTTSTPSQSTHKDGKDGVAVKPGEIEKLVLPCESQHGAVLYEGTPSCERGKDINWEVGESSSVHSDNHTVSHANGKGFCALNNCNKANHVSGPSKKHSTEKYQMTDSIPSDLAVTCVVPGSETDASHTLELSRAEGEGVPQAGHSYQMGEGFFSTDMFPQNLPPLNSNPARYHYHDPPLLQNSHPHPSSSRPPGEHHDGGASRQPQPQDSQSLPTVEHQLPHNGMALPDADAAERGSARSFHSSRNGGSSSEEDDLSILHELEAEASSSGRGSDRGNDLSSSSEDESAVEEFFHGNSEYDSSDAEESVIMLPHLRQKHLDASLSANAVNADVGSLCSHATPPIALSTSQDEGVLSQVHKVRGCLIHQCRMIHSKGGVMVSLQGHALISSCDISNVSYGIRCIQNARVVVVKNRIHHCQTSGIFMRLAASGLITGNDIHSNNEAGLDIRKNADPIVQHNRIHHGKRSGIVVLGSGRGQIRSNSIFSNMEAGIYILYGGNPSVSENHIYDGKAAGVAVNEGGQGFIFDNTISSNQWGGVDIRRGSFPLVCRNTITNGLADGIVIGDQGQGTVENNVISDNAGCGVWIMSASRPYIVGNQISNNGDTGVMMVNKTDVQQEGPHLLPPPEGDGVDPMSGSVSVMGALMEDFPPPAPQCSHTTLQHNNIYHNAGQGIAIELGDKVDVKYNAIYANHKHGVWIHQEAPVIVLGNSITSNYGHGVVTALTPSVEIVGNGIYDNQQWGIQGSGCLQVSENDVVGNQFGGIMMHPNSVCKIQDNRIQAMSGSGVKLMDSTKDSLVERNTLFHGDGKGVQDLSQQAVLHDNKVMAPAPHPDKDSSASRHRLSKESSGFNKTLFLRDPPPRPAIQPPPAPSVLPAHNITMVTKVMVPSGDTCQQGSKLCHIL